MDPQLEAVAKSQSAWSQTANALKRRYESTRKLCFVLSVSAALLAAVASQFDDQPRHVFAIVSAVLLAVVTFLTARFLGGDHAKEWVRARAASEALKRAAFTYAAQAAPYDNPQTSASKLHTEMQLIENDVDDLLNRLAVGKIGKNMPTKLMSQADYAQTRVIQQRDWYAEKAKEAQASAKTLRAIELVLALITTVITAIIGVTAKHTLGAFDFVALTAVLTTLTGAILAYIEASRLDFIVTSYRAAERRLSELLTRPQPPAPAAPSPEWSEYVKAAEDILAMENSSWVAKFGKPA